MTVKPKIEKCKGKTCNADIFWMKTESGKWIPLDVKPHRMFVMETATTQDGVEYTIAKSVPTYMPHHATCPDVDSFRKE